MVEVGPSTMALSPRLREVSLNTISYSLLDTEINVFIDSKMISYVYSYFSISSSCTGKFPARNLTILEVLG